MGERERSTISIYFGQILIRTPYVKRRRRSNYFPSCYFATQSWHLRERFDRCLRYASINMKFTRRRASVGILVCSDFSKTDKNEIDLASVLLVSRRGDCTRRWKV
ncbi:uncharacterized protein LOC143429371 [Xylocopa sonorina]|uniref:uncharacterized protein LOC143429371 n=1 Tax=Xylocopa sonorina TaxID=1818115 RepID=UPI00403ABDBF